MQDRSQQFQCVIADVVGGGATRILFIYLFQMETNGQTGH